MSDSWQPVFGLIAAIFIVSIVLLWLGAVVWAYRDAKERSRDPWMHLISAALVFVFNLPGLVLHLVLRPRETLIETYERRLETEALMGEMPDRRACPSCQRLARPDYLICPYCRTGLRQACSTCSKPLELTWVACPYCGAQGPQHMTMPGSAPPATPFASQPATAPSRSTERTAP